MPQCDKLYKRAQINPKGMRFTEACQLAECYGFVFDHQVGSHRQYKRPGYRGLVNLQDDNGMAKPYQVKQLLVHIEAIIKLMKEEEEEQEHE